MLHLYVYVYESIFLAHYTWIHVCTLSWWLIQTTFLRLTSSFNQLQFIISYCTTILFALKINKYKYVKNNIEQQIMYKKRFDESTELCKHFYDSTSGQLVTDPKSSVHVEVGETFENGSKSIYCYLGDSKKIYGRFTAHPIPSNYNFH